MTTALEAIAVVKRASGRSTEAGIEAVRDMLPLVRDELNPNSTQRFFEAPFVSKTIAVMSLAGRQAVYDEATSGNQPLMSAFNEYVQYMRLVERIVADHHSTYERPANHYMVEVLEADNPTRAAFYVLRKHDGLSPAVMASVLEAAFPHTSAGLNEETRNYLYELAADRGVSSMEIANAYIKLTDMVSAVRFSSTEDEPKVHSEN